MPSSKRAFSLATVEPDQEPAANVLSLTASNSNSTANPITPPKASFFGSLKARLSQTFSNRPNKRQRTVPPESMNGQSEIQITDAHSDATPTQAGLSPSDSNVIYPDPPRVSLYPVLPSSTHVDHLSADDSARHIALLDRSSPSPSSINYQAAHHQKQKQQQESDAKEVAKQIGLQATSSSDPSSDNMNISNQDGSSPSTKSTKGKGKRRKKKKAKRKATASQSQADQNTQEDEAEAGQGEEEPMNEGGGIEEDSDLESRDQISGLEPKLGRSALTNFLEEPALADASIIGLPPRSEDGDPSDRADPEQQQILQPVTSSTSSLNAKEQAHEPKKDELKQHQAEEQQKIVVANGSLEIADDQLPVKEVVDSGLSWTKATSQEEKQTNTKDEDLIDSENLLLRPLRSSSAPCVELEQESVLEGRQRSLEPAIDEDDQENEQEQMLASEEVRTDAAEHSDQEMEEAESVETEQDQIKDNQPGSLEPETHQDDQEGDQTSIQSFFKVDTGANEPAEEDNEEDEEILIKRKSQLPFRMEPDPALKTAEKEYRDLSTDPNEMIETNGATENEGEIGAPQINSEMPFQDETQVQEGQTISPLQSAEMAVIVDGAGGNQSGEEDIAVQEDKENEPPLSNIPSDVFARGAPIVDLTSSDGEEDQGMISDDQINRDDPGALSTNLADGVSNLTLTRTDQRGFDALTRTPSVRGSVSSASEAGSFRAPSYAGGSTVGSGMFGKKVPYKKKDPIGQRDHTKKVQSHNFSKKMEKVNQAFKVWKKALGSKSRTSTREDFLSLIQFAGRVGKVTAQFDRAIQGRPGKIAQIETDEFYTNQFLDKMIWKEQRSSQSVLPTPQYKLDEFQRLEKERRLRAKKARGVLGRRPLPFELEEEQEEEVQDILTRRGKISSMPGAEVSAQDIAKLRPRQWLNDEVINFYGIMIVARSDKAEATRKEAKAAGKKWDRSLNAYWRVHCFSSFFFSKLSTEGYQTVRKWSKRVDLFTKDIALVPINLGNSHWVCAAINFRKKRFEYYDSLCSPNKNAFRILRNYLVEEAKDKKKGNLDLSDWTDYFNPQNPSQQNGFDCGVFASITLEQISRRDPFTAIPDALRWSNEEGKIVGWETSDQENDDDEEEQSGERDWNFSQENMPYLRKRMVYEIATKKLLD